MKKKEEKKYLDKNWAKMQEHFEGFTRTRNQEELHQFRVQVKKIRSFLTLLAVEDKNEKLEKIFKPVKKVFKSAGTVRDAFLHKQQAREHGVKQNEFYKEQNLLQKTESEKLVSKSKKRLRKMKAVKRNLQKHLQGVSASDIRFFYKKKLVDTKQLLAKHNFSEELHDGRKMLKHLMYNHKAVPNKTLEKLKINFDYIDELQDLLGEWHDNKLALAFFDKDLSETDLQTMKEKNRELEKAITKKAGNFEKEIHAEPASGKGRK